MADEDNLFAWGWSDTSPEDALAHAMTRAQRMREWIARGKFNPVDSHYGYPDRPMREEVLREFQDAGGPAGSAVVSRNSMGCLVLNTTSLMFVDVDLPDTEPVRGAAGGLFSLLFGRKKDKPVETPPPPPDNRIMAKVDAWLQSHPGWGWRVYQTRAGVRLAATHQPVIVRDAVVGDAFAAFDADPLYRDLCGRQECFRARLTAKPWRCGTPKLRARYRWPWNDPTAEERFRAWEERYLAAAKDYATCKLVGQFGAQEIHPALRELVDFHDKATRADAAMPLA